MKNLVFVVTLLVCSIASYAQQYLDVVYLKNGSIIRGVITEQIPNETIKIESQGNVFAFRIDEIEKLGKELQDKKQLKERRPEMTKGYRGIAELGLGVGYGNGPIYKYNFMVKLNLVNSYRFNPFLAVGLNTGARFLLRDGISLVPVMADIRINALNRKFSPYLVLNLGNTYNATWRFQKFGTMFGFEIGSAIKVSPKHTFNIGLGYEAIVAYEGVLMTDFFYGDYRSFALNMGLTF